MDLGDEHKRECEFCREHRRKPRTKEEAWFHYFYSNVLPVVDNVISIHQTVQPEQEKIDAGQVGSVTLSAFVVA